MTLTSTQGTALIDPIVPLALAALRRRFAGELLTPDMAAFQRARRLVNDRFDRHPALVARARHAQDVAQAVVFAREHGLELAVDSGGHSIPGHSSGDGVLLVDLSAMKRIAISQDRRSARVQLGVTNGGWCRQQPDAAVALRTEIAARVGKLTGRAIDLSAVVLEEQLQAALVSVDGIQFRWDRSELTVIRPCAHCDLGRFATPPIRDARDLGYALSEWRPLHPGCELFEPDDIH